MTLRADELAALCREASTALVGLPVHKVVQPDDETVLLQLRGRWLLLSCGARTGRLHLVSEKAAGTGEAAPAFCMLLRKHLMNARLESIEAVEGERACELTFLTTDDTPRLRLFLFGTAGQLQLVARDDSEPRVLASVGPARRVHETLPPPHPSGAAHQAVRFSTSVEAEAFYGHLAHEADVEGARHALLRRLNEEARKLVRLEGHLLKDRVRADDAAERQRHADLILAHLHEIPRGVDRITLPNDFTDGSPIEIALDPAKSARVNADRMYHEHRRLHRARSATETKLADVQARLAVIAVQRVAIESQPDEALLASARTLEEQQQQRTKTAEEAATLPYKTFVSAMGVPIYVGRGAKKNDELTFRVARGNDLWLHTRDVPGAHVIVPLPSGRSVDPETLVDAATLAVYHSSVRDEAQADVGYALRKHLRKPKGAAPGAVMVSNQKTLRVRMEPARLQRLLGRT